MRRGAQRIAKFQPHALCCLTIDETQDSSAAALNDPHLEDVQQLESIDAAAIVNAAHHGRNVVCINSSIDLQFDAVFARSIRILQSIWRAPAKTDRIVCERNKVSRACYALMVACNCSEQAAYSELRTRAMERRIRISEMAERVLRSELIRRMPL
ncbi:MAG: ANTAR domain-containing protein [Hyphomicrobiaceae bacterium]